MLTSFDNETATDGRTNKNERNYRDHPLRGDLIRFLDIILLNEEITKFWIQLNEGLSKVEGK